MATRKPGPVVLISGGSRGLGLALAQEWARKGARLSLCARDAGELERARKQVSRYAREVETHVCDVTDRADCGRWIRDSLAHYGQIDVLVNNAGIMEVGPLDSLDEKAFRDNLDTNLWSMIHTTLIALPHLKKGARIVNITSIGAGVSVPHLLPYSVSKFAALGFSLGLDAEVAQKGISVTSVLPGLMRTGSAIQARFRGQVRKEFGWFSLAAGFPFITISAERAARSIVSAATGRRRFLVIGAPAKLLLLLRNLFPGLTLGVMRGVIRLLPKSEGSPGQDAVPGLTLGDNKGLAKEAGRRLNEKAV